MRAQTDAEARAGATGESCTGTCDSGNKPAIVLAGHSYNAFTPGRVAIGGQETIEHGSGGNSR